MQLLLALIKTFRIHQWTKNLLVFAALVFSLNLDDPAKLVKAVYAFLAFCFLSSSVYVINDLLDAERDRAHPVKRHRPIASGRLNTRDALAGALVLFALAILLARSVRGGPEFMSVLGGYFVLNLAYSTTLKKVVVADVMVIAFGFLLRVAAGGLAIGVEVSHWLILCTFFVATMLACCKRRSEMASLENNSDTRAVLADYSLTLLDIYIAISATATVLAYALYTVAERTLKEFKTAALIYTVPVVMYGISRYLFLVYRRRAGEDPAAVLIRDPGMILVILIWSALVCGILYHAI
jgi:4-hydroxybenzoate polyprenyltransferase